MFFRNFFRNTSKELPRYAASVIVTMFAVTTVTYAVTTISTNIATDGTLSVVGAAAFTADISVNGGDINLGTGSATSTLTSSGGLLGLASTTPWGLFSVESVAGTVLDGVPIFVIGDAGTTTPMFYVSGNANVGIGTTRPVQALHVSGSALISTDVFV